MELFLLDSIVIIGKEMGNLLRITIISLICLFCHVYGSGFTSFIRDIGQDISQEMREDETVTLFELGSQLRSLGK